MVTIKICKSASDFLDKFADFVFSAGITLFKHKHNTFKQNGRKPTVVRWKLPPSMFVC